MTDDAPNEPENNCSAACREITFVIIKNTRPILNAFPVITKVEAVSAQHYILYQLDKMTESYKQAWEKFDVSFG